MDLRHTGLITSPLCPIQGQRSGPLGYAHTMFFCWQWSSNIRTKGCPDELQTTWPSDGGIFCVTLDLDPVDRGRSTVGVLSPKRGYFLESWVRRGPPARVALGGLAGIDYGMPEFFRRPRFWFRTLSVEPIMKMSRLGHRWIYQDGTIVRGSVGSTPSFSYSLGKIDLERPSVPVVDISDSDSETVDGLVGPDMDIEEDPSEPTIEMDTTE
ncbi:hypothetical protein M9H77_09469 [Catharanthus roseus]|uniref:Uncharacterized protein n=1 Tax=Catharanthus roseus TaxID=4058 RepID=A0ACC0C0W5_CATRO|nr:hypothetical protein M9H77_09469 [Catharanthus roseus]